MESSYSNVLQAKKLKDELKSNESSLEDLRRKLHVAEERAATSDSLCTQLKKRLGEQDIEVEHELLTLYLLWQAKQLHHQVQLFQQHELEELNAKAKNTKETVASVAAAVKPETLVSQQGK